MRMKVSNIKTMYFFKRTVTTGTEGQKTESYGTGTAIKGEWWPAGGEVQAKMYGDKLSYYRNVKIKGDYTVSVGNNGVIAYTFSEYSNMALCENDAIGIERNNADYRIIAIKPYKPLTLEVMRI